MRILRPFQRALAPLLHRMRGSPFRPDEGIIKYQAVIPKSYPHDPTAFTRGDAVLKGIADNPDAETFFVTGKFRQRMFETHFVPVEG